jgi:hypothetical protein
MSLDKPKRRRCAYKRCRRLLPKDATSRRRYCGPTCVAGAYRMRRRQERAHQMMTILVDAKAAEFLRTTTGPEERLLAQQTCGGPNCRVVLWAGARRRRSARYCSARCRQAAYRARRRSRDHDAVP